jgi:hypothetical protein
MPQNPEADAVGQMLAKLQAIQQAIPKGLAQTTSTEPRQTSFPGTPWIVDPTRFVELRAIQSQEFDLSKLLRYCEELNINYEGGCFLAVTMLGRAILDHVPPIFGCKNFTEVANNYSGGTKSFKQSMEHLDNSLRKIADAHLHVQIRKSEILPNRTQVNFSSDLDVMLAEIVRLLKQKKT